MKKIIIVLSLVACSFTPCKAADFRDISEFMAGVAVAYAGHELGHQTAAYLTGTDITWELGNGSIVFNENCGNRFNGTFINASGISVQLITNEVIIRNNFKRSNFTDGIVFWNTFNPIYYAIDYWLINRSNKRIVGSYRGDIQGIEYYSGSDSANIFAAATTIVAVNQGIRYFSKNKPKYELNLLPKGVGASISIPF